MKLSTVMPAYRQEATIAKDVRNVDRELGSSEIDYEILVVVDGFVDGTYGQAKLLERDSDAIRVLGYLNNGGKGHAVRHGMREAAGELIAFLDAGMDLDPHGLIQAVQLLERTGADVVVGSKRHPDSKVSYPPLRRLYSMVYQLLVWLLFGLNIRDTQVGLKVFRRQVIDDIEPLLLVKRFAFDVEMLVVAQQMGHRQIVESPITLTHGRFPSTIRLRSIFEMLWDTAAVFYRARVLHYYEGVADGRRREEVSAVSELIETDLPAAASRR